MSRWLNTALSMEIIVTAIFGHYSHRLLPIRIFLILVGIYGYRYCHERDRYLWSQVCQKRETILFTELLMGFYCHRYFNIHMCDIKYGHRKLLSQKNPGHIRSQLFYLGNLSSVLAFKRGPMLSIYTPCRYC